MMRILATALVVLSLCGSSLFAERTAQLQGTWKLRSQRTVAGTPPSFSPGLIMSFDGTGKLARLNGPVPPAIVSHDRMRFTVSTDGRVLTQEAKGTDEKTGKPYRYVLTWDKQ